MQVNTQFFTFFLQFPQKVNVQTFVQEKNKAAYEKAMKDNNFKNIEAVGAVIMLSFNNEGLCDECEVECYHSNLKNATSAIVAFSNYAYNSEVDKDSYIARIDREDYKDHVAFIDGVKNKDWERVQKTMSKNDDIFSIGGSKNEKEEVLYAARYIHGLDD